MSAWTWTGLWAKAAQRASFLGDLSRGSRVQLGPTSVRLKVKLVAATMAVYGAKLALLVRFTPTSGTPGAFGPWHAACSKGSVQPDPRRGTPP